MPRCLGEAVRTHENRFIKYVAVAAVRSLLTDAVGCRAIGCAFIYDGYTENAILHWKVSSVWQGIYKKET
jgi:hypothetical protein